MKNFSYKALDTTLKTLGIENIFFCAGARNARLVELLSSYKLEFFIDERSASFRALGMAKAIKKPVAVCTTSGTAVSECFSAVIEAYYSDVPLIIISADRPTRLHGTHAPQCIEQKYIFGNYCKKTLYDGDEFELQDIKYPLHINVEIDELSDDYHSEVSIIKFSDFESELKNSEYPVAIFTEGDDDYQEEFNLLNSNGFPIYVECTSHFSSETIQNQIFYEKDLTKALGDKKLDLVIKFGKTPFVKLWRLLDSPHRKVKVFSYKNDKTALPYGRILVDNLSSIPKKNYQINKNTEDFQLYLRKYPLSEISILKNIVSELKDSDQIYIGNSMPIRYLQMLNIKDVKVHASRGANGIDGQLSTAIGLAMGSSKTIHCIVGDLTFLYDLNSIVGDIPKNLKIHIINNQGGRIFERVKVSKKMLLEHEISVKNLTEGFENKDQLFEYFPCNIQTKEFWKDWEKK